MHTEWWWKDGKRSFRCMEMKKNSWGSNTYIWQIRSQSKGHTRDKEGHFIILKGLIQQDDITLINIYAPNAEAPEYIKKSGSY